MDFELNEAQRAVEVAPRRVAVEKLAPFAAKCEEEACFPVEMMYGTNEIMQVIIARELFRQ